MQFPLLPDCLKNILEIDCEIALHSITKKGILKFSKTNARMPPGGIAMIEATSCGGVVIFRGKILLLYKNYKNRYEGWVLPKGTV